MAQLVYPYPYSDPIDLPTPEPPYPDNPLSLFSDSGLLNTQLLLLKGCGRAHLTAKKRARAQFCALGFVLDIERRKRGLPIA